MLPSTTDVLIVGAGPTGLALAISLQQAGIAQVLIDKPLHRILHRCERHESARQPEYLFGCPSAQHLVLIES